MQCLIIAAGKGSRLAARGDSKPLIELKGVPLIERVMLTVMDAGIKDFYVVTGYNGDKIRERLARFKQTQPAAVDYIHNDEWEKQNGISVFCARHKLRTPFLLLMSDHLFDSSIVTDLLAEGTAPGVVKLAVDKRIEHNSFVDIDDVTKVLEVRGRILDIGKTIPRYNAFDTGIFLATPALFDALEESIAGGDSSLSGGIRQMARKQQAAVFDIGDRRWIDIDDDAAFMRAESIFNLA